MNKKHWRYTTRLLHKETVYDLTVDFVMKLKSKYFESVKNS